MRIVTAFAAAAGTVSLLYTQPVASSVLGEPQNQTIDNNTTRLETPPIAGQPAPGKLQTNPELAGIIDGVFAPAAPNAPALLIGNFTAFDKETAAAPAMPAPKTTLSIGGQNSGGVIGNTYGLFAGQAEEDHIQPLDQRGLTQNLLIRDLTQIHQQFGNDSFSFNLSTSFITAPEDSYLHGHPTAGAFVANANMRFAYQGLATGFGGWSDSRLQNGFYNEIWGSYARPIGAYDCKVKFLVDRQISSGWLNKVATFTVSKKLPALSGFNQEIHASIDDVKPAGPGSRSYQDAIFAWGLAKKETSLQVSAAHRSDTGENALIFSVHVRL